MKLTGWGRYPIIDANILIVETYEQAQSFLNTHGELLVHAMGRSYGDSALASNVISTRRMNRFIAFDPQTGELTCEAGTSLSDIIRCVLPRGWFLPVTPGTQYVSIGGAIAADVHGKNHHRDGCFSSCVKSIHILLADGRMITCSKDENADLFHATCGGMGLTGIILSATINLLSVPSRIIRQKIFKAKNLEHVFELFDENVHWPYSVAWIDCQAQGPSMGRSLLMVGEHTEQGRLFAVRGKNLSVPFDFPRFTLNTCSIKLFNALYYNRIKKSVLENMVDIESFFYPLDAVEHWNRIYGKNGFTQYQFVLPKDVSFKGLKSILTRISATGLGSFLAVLKLFGPANDNFLSFPCQGYTLALDFKIENKLFRLLDDLDKIVCEFGGRIYLAKDVRMKPGTFAQGYTRLEEFQKVASSYDPHRKFTSKQSQRLRLRP